MKAYIYIGVVGQVTAIAILWILLGIAGFVLGVVAAFCMLVTCIACVMQSHERAYAEVNQ